MLHRIRPVVQARKKTESSVEIDILRHVRHGLRESGFLLLAVVGVYLMLSLMSFNLDDPAWTHADGTEKTTNLGGVIGAWFADIALYFFGYFAYALPLGILFCGWMLFRCRRLDELDAEIVLFRSLGFLVALASGCGLASLHLRRLPDYLTSSAGGIVGDVIGQSLISAFSFVGGTLFLVALFLAGITLATGLSWVGLMDLVGRLTLDIVAMMTRFVELIRSRFLPEPASTPAADTGVPRSGRRVEPVIHADQPAQDSPVPIADPVTPRRESEPTGDEASTALDTPLVATREAPAPVEEMAGSEWEAVEPGSSSPSSRGEREVTINQPRPVIPDAVPPLELLDPARVGKDGYSPELLEEMSRQVETLLRHFGIEVQVVAVEPGPVITRFEVEPAPGVKVSQISNLAKDLARGLSVISVRVVEVIPGKSVVGLEIPNQSREVVYLSEILNSSAYSRSVSPLTLALGKDIGGNPIVANLAKMPHLLVAGTTGAGKSVAVNAMLLSMLYKAGPREVRLILVDPKMLELSIYEGIPHLLAPVVTDMKEAANALRWCVAEMERRYRLMAALKVRNITGFNQKVGEALKAGQPIADPLYKPEEHVGEEGEIPTLEPLPFIVVVIDELADMMMIVGKKVEELIARLAQKARASGIHLILATQRPSVDVITGLIKANIPTRIAFQVSSKVDSRTILDQMGAEQLLGHGDMLYLPPGTGFSQRVHGAFVDDHEVNRVVEFLKQTGEPEYMDTILQEPGEGGGGFSGIDGADGGSEGEADPLYDQAVRIVTESRRASISGVQRRLKIGYNRAARMIEEMETAGIVGPLQANGSREVIAPPPPEA